MVRPKLEVSQAGDRLEREADRLADAVMRMPARSDAAIPRKRMERAGVGDARGREAVPGQGTPLPAAERAYFEPRFGHDFSQVRVHWDASAAESARSYAALAYTVGQDIVFGAGRFRPGTAEGRRLLAHELAHAQQADADVVRREELTERTPLPVGLAGSEPEGAPTAQGADFRGCSPEQDAMVSESLRIGWYAVSNAEREVQAALTFPLDPDRHLDAVEALLRGVFHTLDRRHLQTIRGHLGHIRTIMEHRRAWNWVCRTDAQCTAVWRNEPYAFAGPDDPVRICPLFFDDTNEIFRAEILIHESAHQAGLMRNRRGRDTTLTARQTLDNADSYAVFAIDRLYGELASEWGSGHTPLLGMEIWVGGDFLVYDTARRDPTDSLADSFVGNQMLLVVRYFHGTAAPAVDAPDTVLSLRVTLERDEESRGSLPARETLVDRTDDAPVAGVGRYAGRLLSSIPEYLDRPMSAADRGRLHVEASIADPGGTVLDAADFRVVVTGRYVPTGP